MQTRRLGFWVYWLSAATLIALIAPGVTQDMQVSAASSEVASGPESLARPETVAMLPVPAVAHESSSAAVAESPVVAGAAAAGTDAVDPVAAKASDQVGIASWYGGWHQGHLTASGERFDSRKLTAAHRTLPLDTKVKVTNLENGKSVEVKVNDRGPYVPGRVLDLSTQAAKQLGMEKEGLALVRIQVLPDQVADAVN